MKEFETVEQWEEEFLNSIAPITDEDIQHALEQWQISTYGVPSDFDFDFLVFDEPEPPVFTDWTLPELPDIELPTIE